METTPKPDGQPAPAYLSEAERRAVKDLSTTANPVIQLAPGVLARLVAQLEAQQQQLLLHTRRERGLRDVATAWQTLGSYVDLGPDFADYYDAGSEVLGVLDNPHFGDPRYDDHEPEPDGRGWRAPQPSLNSQLS